MIDIALVKPSRMAAWFCFGVYLAAFALPVKLDVTYVPGVSLFLLGAVGFVMSLYGLVYTLFEGLSLDIIRFVVASVPWLANLFFWFGLALYAQGHGRASLRAGLIAAFLAAVVLTSSNPLSGRDFYGPRTESVLSELTSPAYLAWAGSMVMLVCLAGYLAWRQNRAAALWQPTPAWPVEHDYTTLDELSRRIFPNGSTTSEAVVADKQTK